ncbi:hypothetical protein RR49_01174 [Microbacterium ginsengisoli]|uniref:Uncharacterized protein n=1 Tax=Microbacterium ginsengisoli TaxID=400772 RepID=A0A0F0LUT6_9MICO|nr:hypothetical protein RR49_01174 [Microbacterium ginsengisoli]
MPADREALARLLHDAVTAKARAERANVDQWEDLAAYFRANFLRMADAVITAGWAPAPSLFELAPPVEDQALRERIKLAIQTAQDDEGHLLYSIPPGVAGMYADAVMRVFTGRPYPYATDSSEHPPA